MRGGIKALFVTAGLAATGCTTSASDINIRPLADPGSKLGARNGLLADASAQLAIGNVGLAIEGFRKALREQPDSIAALGGLAACYDEMGRYDLSRLNYEAALAIAPTDPVLLNSFAASLERQGKRMEALAVRAEAAQLASAADALDRTQAEAEAPAAPIRVAAVAPAAPIGVAAVAQPAPAPVVIGPSVTVTLPPPRPVEAPREVPIPAPTLRQVAVDLGQFAGPRLERLSPGVVALITIEQPAVQPKVIARTATSTTVRWVPVSVAGVLGRPNIRLLNAARNQGLAARTRGYLLGRGWRKIEIGDAAQVRARSIVYYPASRRMTGRSLAAQFGFASAVQQGDVLVVLLGRDAAAKGFQIRG
ncbi:MAG TPA: LytR C-terminal domain-containing protein [Sphingomicrobium sp.]|nr:LytR C-terminal domain-containing protein [Sphingomicrobium sp.]